MFNIDTGDSGTSQGPWITWSSNGSAEKGIAPRSWVLRSKDANGNRVEQAIPAFAQGCVMDLDTLKLGWEKDGARGMAPERRWNPSISQPTPRPDESKKPNGKYAWSKALSVRVAVSATQAATWEQGSFGAYEAFSMLSKKINAEWSANSQNGRLLPVIVMTGVEKKDLPSGPSNLPILSIAKWVERPACLSADAPMIATEAPTPAYTAPAPTFTPPPAQPQAAPSAAW